MKYTTSIEEKKNTTVTKKMESCPEGIKLRSSGKLKRNTRSAKIRRKSKSFSNSISRLSVRDVRLSSSQTKQRKSEPQIRIKNERKIEVISKLGSGACGTVYSCFVDGFICAMKEVQLTGEEMKYLGNNLSEEVKVLESLPSHQNIVNYLFHEREETCFKIYFRQYQRSLDDVIQSFKKVKKQIPVAQIVDILFQIAEGLKFLREHNLIHRDIKPQNIFVQSTIKSDTYVIGDLDSAIIINNNNKACTVVGTPCYMAPEVFASKKDKPYSFPADIFSFGMLIYELITLQVPYHDVTYLQIANYIISGIPPSMPEINPEYESLKELYISCTNNSPDARPSIENVSIILGLLKNQFTVEKSKNLAYTSTCPV